MLQAPSHPPQPLQEDVSYPNHSHLSPQDTRLMAALPQVLSTQESMQHPVSPISVHSPVDGQIVEQISRKRSHSQMSHDGQIMLSGLPTRAPSIPPARLSSTSPAPDDYSPRGSRSFKRGDPPMDQNNKYFCDFSTECAGQTFDRKCEWSKHMDKHDRPYRCPHQDCSKLQGFTYSGGLLRHEREVHGKHGGPKAQLMCPYEDCKRHSGKGFTRKENLNEHMRRCHENKASPLHSATGPSVLGAEQPAEASIAHVSDGAAIYDDMAVTAGILGKRDYPETENVDELKQELKRLREDNEAKEERMRRMEAQEAHRVMEMEKLRQELQEFRESKAGQHVQD